MYLIVNEWNALQPFLKTPRRNKQVDRGECHSFSVITVARVHGSNFGIGLLRVFGHLELIWGVTRWKRRPPRFFTLRRHSFEFVDVMGGAVPRVRRGHVIAVDVAEPPID